MILLFTNHLTVPLIASTGPLPCDVAKNSILYLRIEPAFKPKQSSSNKFWSYSLLILWSWGFTIFCKISMKTVIESLQWCKSSDITTADTHKSLCQKHEEIIVICFLFQWGVCSSWQKVEKFSEKMTGKTPTESVSLASFKFCW